MDDPSGRESLSFWEEVEDALESVLEDEDASEDSTVLDSDGGGAGEVFVNSEKEGSFADCEADEDVESLEGRAEEDSDEDDVEGSA